MQQIGPQITIAPRANRSYQPTYLLAWLLVRVGKLGCIEACKKKIKEGFANFAPTLKALLDMTHINPCKAIQAEVLCGSRPAINLK